MHWLLALSFIGFSIVGHTRGSMRWMERSGAEQERSVPFPSTNLPALSNLP